MVFFFFGFGGKERARVRKQEGRKREGTKERKTERGKKTTLLLLLTLCSPVLLWRRRPRSR